MSNIEALQKRAEDAGLTVMHISEHQSTRTDRPAGYDMGIRVNGKKLTRMGMLMEMTYWIDGITVALSASPTHTYTYEHRHGLDMGTFVWTGDGEPTEAQVVKGLDLDFEPDRDEYLNFERIAGFTPRFGPSEG